MLQLTFRRILDAFVRLLNVFLYVFVKNFGRVFVKTFERVFVRFR